MKYRTAWIFTKKGNLLPWLRSKCLGSVNAQAQEFYGQEREIQLLLLLRSDNEGIHCRIKCPVNPLPVKGEFMVPSVSAIHNFLRQNGWHKEQTIHSEMFN